MRSTARITSQTGSTVQAMALSSDSHSTGSGTSAADSGRIATNCSRQKPAATLEASPTSRSDPSRCTMRPLPTR